MAAYNLIATTTVGSGGASTIDFTSIPQTYTDLMLVVSARQATGTNAVGDLTFNGLTTNLSERYLTGDGASATSATGTKINPVLSYSTDTASTFGNATIYIANYTGSTNKSVSIDSVSENNATSAFQRLVAGLWSSSAAITQVTLTSPSGNWAQYSSASLYGIKNS